MKTMQRSLLWVVIVVSSAVIATAQAPAPQGGAARGGGRGGAPRLVLSVSSTAWPDGGEVPMRHAGRGDNKSPAFVFEFYALDTKLDLPANTTRDDLLKAMDGHVIGKAAYVGRFHAPPQ